MAKLESHIAYTLGRRLLHYQVPEYFFGRAYRFSPVAAGAASRSKNEFNVYGGIASILNLSDTLPPYPCISAASRWEVFKTAPFSICVFALLCAEHSTAEKCGKEEGVPPFPSLSSSGQLGDGKSKGLRAVQDMQQHDDSLVRCHRFYDSFNIFKATVGHLYFVAHFEKSNGVIQDIELLTQGINQTVGDATGSSIEADDFANPTGII